MCLCKLLCKQVSADFTNIPLPAHSPPIPTPNYSYSYISFFTTLYFSRFAQHLSPLRLICYTYSSLLWGPSQVNRIAKRFLTMAPPKIHSKQPHQDQSEEGSESSTDESAESSSSSESDIEVAKPRKKHSKPQKASLRKVRRSRSLGILPNRMEPPITVLVTHIL